MTVSKEGTKKIRPEVRGIIVWGRVEQESDEGLHMNSLQGMNYENAIRKPLFHTFIQKEIKLKSRDSPGFPACGWSHKEL